MKNMEAELTDKEVQRRQEVGALRAEMAQLEVEVGTLREGGGGAAAADSSVGAKAQLAREQAQLEEDQKQLQKISAAMNARLSLQLDLITDEQGAPDAAISAAQGDQQELRQLQQELQSVVGRGGGGGGGGSGGKSRRRISQSGGGADDASRLERKLLGTTEELRRARAAQAEAEARAKATEERFGSYKEQALGRAAQQETRAQKDLRRAQLQGGGSRRVSGRK